MICLAEKIGYCSRWVSSVPLLLLSELFSFCLVMCEAFIHYFIGWECAPACLHTGQGKPQKADKVRGSNLLWGNLWCINISACQDECAYVPHTACPCTGAALLSEYPTFPSYERYFFLRALLHPTPLYFFNYYYFFKWMLLFQGSLSWLHSGDVSFRVSQAALCCSCGLITQLNYWLLIKCRSAAGVGFEV